MFSIIVAMGKNGEIGKENKLLWNIPEDLKNFKNITLNKKIIMGRKTFESIGKPLINRENIVLSQSNNVNSENIKVVNSIDEIVEKYYGIEEEVFIIGGGQIYDKFIKNNLVNKMYISHINYENNDADAYFPNINFNEWEIIEEKSFENWKFCIYEKNKR